MRIPADAVEVDLNAVSAGMRLQDLSVPDAGGPGNGTGPPPAVPARVSLVMQWGSAGASLTVRDAPNGFAGTYQECQATIEWSAAEDDFSFRSDPAATSMTRFAQIGRERSGVFATGESG